MLRINGAVTSTVFHIANFLTFLETCPLPFVSHSRAPSILLCRNRNLADPHHWSDHCLLPLEIIFMDSKDAIYIDYSEGTMLQRLDHTLVIIQMHKFSGDNCIL